MTSFKFYVEPEQAGSRLDSYLTAVCEGMTRSALQQLIAKGNVQCNGKAAGKSCRVASGDCIALAVPEPEPVDVIPQEIPLSIVYEDAHLLVVNKPKGMVVHPAAGNPDKTLVNALLFHCAGQLSGINGELRPGIVHRIDKDTSGLLVVAKDNETHTGLAAQLAVHSMTRVYEAVAYGGFSDVSGFVEAPLGRHPVERKKMAITEKNGRYAYTGYEVLRRYVGFTHLALRLKTGRTHQIRVHMASIGHPLAGDAVYGPKKVITQLCGQCLHAKTLGFVHPITGEYLEFDSALPPYFTAFLATLRPAD